MRIRQLVYSSSQVFSFDGLALVSLLYRARERNAAHGITGVLFYANGMFVQCLEGPPEHVEALYARIRADRRHDSLVLLQSIDTDWRHFPRWTMGCAKVPDFQALQLVRAEWEQDLTALDADAPHSPGFMLMKSLWDTYKDYGFVDLPDTPA